MTTLYNHLKVSGVSQNKAPAPTWYSQDVLPQVIFGVPFLKVIVHRLWNAFKVMPDIFPIDAHETIFAIVGTTYIVMRTYWEHCTTDYQWS